MTDPDVDRASAYFRTFDLGPLPDLDLDAVVRGGHRRRRLIAVDRALALAAVVVLLAGAGVVLSRASGPTGPTVTAPPGPASTSAPAPSSSEPSAPAPTSPAPSTGALPPSCTASELRPSATGGGAGGTEYVVLRVLNTGSRVCWLAGFPDLAGVDASGRATRLAFTRSSDPAQVTPPVYEPGPLVPGQDGAVSLSLADHDCSLPTPSYRELRITLGSGTTLTMPFPPELQVTGCYGMEGPVGPVPPSGQTLGLAPADSALPAAGTCPTSPGPVVTVSLNGDTPDPRCVTVTGNQRLRLVNTTNRTAGLPPTPTTVTWAGFPSRDLSPGESTTYDLPFSAYLAPGVHDVHVSLYGGSGPEIWLR